MKSPKVIDPSKYTLLKRAEGLLPSYLCGIPSIDNLFTSPTYPKGGFRDGLYVLVGGQVPCALWVGKVMQGLIENNAVLTEITTLPQVHLLPAYADCSGITFAMAKNLKSEIIEEIAHVIITLKKTETEITFNTTKKNRFGIPYSHGSITL
jgi:hypothetical protein